MTRPPREPGKKPVKPRFTFACEDEKSAPAYLRELFNFYPEIIFRIIPHKHKSSPEQVVSRIAKNISRVAENTSDTDKLDRNWAIIDADPHAPPRCGQIDSALDDARKNQVEVIISNPCFEHWLRLHLKKCDGGNMGTKKLIADLKKLWHEKFSKDYNKDNPDNRDFEILINEKLHLTARDFAKKQHNQKKGVDQSLRPHKCQPCVTDFYRIIDAIIETLEKLKNDENE